MPRASRRSAPTPRATAFMRLSARRAVDVPRSGRCPSSSAHPRACALPGAGQGRGRRGAGAGPPPHAHPQARVPSARWWLLRPAPAFIRPLPRQHLQGDRWSRERGLRQERGTGATRRASEEREIRATAPRPLEGSSQCLSQLRPLPLRIDTSLCLPINWTVKPRVVAQWLSIHLGCPGCGWIPSKGRAA